MPCDSAVACRNPSRVGGAWPLGQQQLDQRLAFTRAEHVACGEWHTALVTTDGDVWTWGAGDDGQLGHYNWECRRFPTMVYLSLLARSLSLSLPLSALSPSLARSLARHINPIPLSLRVNRDILHDPCGHLYGEAGSFFS